MSVNVLLILGMGGLVGFLSGLFGVGGGFLMTPLLIFVGVPPTVAVGTQANQLVGASVSGVLANLKRGGVDFKMGGVLVAGGLVGSVIGVWLFSVAKQFGQIDFVISVTYVVMLGSVGALMLNESLRAILKRRKDNSAQGKLHQHTWLHGLPLKMRFPKSRLYISALAPLGLGLMAGILVAIMGVGGGFFMVPAMIYVLGMPTSAVPGTSLFQIIFVTAATTLLHAVATQTVDVMLALLLLIGGVVGAQFGGRIGGRLRGEQMRFALAVIVLLVCLKLFADLIITPDDLYSLSLPGAK